MVKTGKSEVVLKFDWLELASYMSPTVMVLFHSWTLYALRSVEVYFFLIYILFPLIELYGPKYSKNHSE